METERIKEHEVSLEKIELNNQGDYVIISADDPTLFDRFAAGYKSIVDMSDAIPGKLKEIEKRYEGKEDFSSIMEKTVEMSRVNVDFSKEAVVVIDGILGEGSVKKHFRSVYEEIPEFLPDADCFIAFLEELTPIMERLFDRKMEKQRKASKARMEKYKPQDFKKKKGKGR